MAQPETNRGVVLLLDGLDKFGFCKIRDKFNTLANRVVTGLGEFGILLAPPVIARSTLDTGRLASELNDGRFPKCLDKPNFLRVPLCLCAPSVRM